MKDLIVKTINIYQKFLSPDHSFWAKHRFPNGYCRYYPTCSEYSKQAIEKKGILKGFFMSIWRIIRCNPWSKGGVDMVIKINRKTAKTDAKTTKKKKFSQFSHNIS